MPPAPLAAISSSSWSNVAGSIEPPPFQNRYNGSCERAGAANALLIGSARAGAAAQPANARTSTAVDIPLRSMDWLLAAQHARSRPAKSLGGRPLPDPAPRVLGRFPGAKAPSATIGSI